MKTNSILLLFSFLGILACSTTKNNIPFSQKITREAYHQIAKDFGLDQANSIDRLYDREVNIKNFDQFKAQGVDLSEIYGRDYRSRSLRSDVIIVGTIHSQKEDPGNVLFHTEYSVSVEKVIKKKNWIPTDSVTLKVTYGPAGKYTLASIAGTDRYQVGETVLLYLEPMEKTFQAYEARDLKNQTNSISRINANRKDPNVFQPLKKYTFKDGNVYEQTNGLLGTKSEIFKGIKKMNLLNRMK